MSEPHSLEGNVRYYIPVVNNAIPGRKLAVKECSGVIVSDPGRSIVVDLRNLAELELHLDSAEGRESSTKTLASDSDECAWVFTEEFGYMFIGLVGNGFPGSEEPGMYLTALAANVRDLLKAEVFNPVFRIDGASEGNDDAVNAFVVADVAVDVGFVVVEDGDLRL